MLGLDSRAYNELHSGGTLSGMGGRRPSTKSGGGAGDAHHLLRVVVDVREFRSSLPSLLHASG